MEEHVVVGPSRRAVLAAGAIAVGGLAGCTDDEDVDAAVFDAPETIARDEAFSVTIEALPPNERAVVIVQTTARDDSQWGATATVDTASGTIDLDAVEFLESDVPPDVDTPTTMALVQSLQPEGDAGGFQPPDRETLHVSVSIDGTSYGTTTVDRLLTDPDGTMESIDHDELVGYYYAPPGDEPTPAVITLHGSEGVPMIVPAALLAMRGFAVLALQYFGTDPLSDTLSDLPLEYVETAIEWLLERDRVDADRVGLYGGSRGGELALLAGSEFDTVGPVVSINGSGVVWPGRFEGESSWTIDGESVPYVPYVEHENWGTRTEEPAFTASFEEAYPERREQATIPVEEIHGPILLVSGGDDKLWNAETFQDVSATRLEAADHEAFEHRVYEDAGHSIAPPYGPVIGRDSGPRFDLGGTPAGTAEADVDFWPRAIETLRGEW